MILAPPWTIMHQLKLNLKIMLLLLTSTGWTMQLENLQKLKIGSTSSLIEKMINVKRKQALGALKSILVTTKD